MAVSNIITEDGNRIVQETVPGITGATSLNDTHIETINMETFDTDPLTRSWLIGSGWAWSAGNKNVAAV